MLITSYICTSLHESFVSVVRNLGCNSPSPGVVEQLPVFVAGLAQLKGVILVLVFKIYNLMVSLASIEVFQVSHAV